MAENILFGTPVGPYFAVGNLGRNEFVLKVIQEVVLSRAFLEKGRKLAATMIDIFRDLAPGHEFFSRFSFISGEDLPAFEAILRRADQNGIDGLDGEDRARLMALPFKLIVNQHHVGLIDADMQTRLLHARKVFAQALPPELRGMVQIFDAKTYNAASSIADNVIFGKIATNRADSAPVIGRLLSDVLDELNLRAGVIEAGLGMDIGVGGARLTVAQRQKLVLARTLLKRPDILVLSDALAAIDPAEQDAVLARISGSMAGRSLFLIEPNDRRAAYFEHVLRMDRGRITQAEGARTAQAADAEPAAEGGDVGLNEIVGILQRIPLFAGIDRSKLKLLAFTSDHAAFDRGQFVFKQGDRGDNAYVIIDGEVDVVLESIGGPRIVAVLGRDQVFGEMALLSNAPRTTSIRARGPMKAVVITSDVFLRLIEENSAIAANMMRTLAARLATTLQNYGKVSASHDLMTELPSQRVFLETARLAQASRKRSGKQTAIMLFDLGALSAAVKQIARDEIPSAFKQAAQRMRACLRGGDILAHLRDTQYGVILTEFAGEQDARAAAQRIAGAMRAPFKVGGQSVDLAFSIEFRVVPLDEGQVTQTLERCRSEDATTFVLAS